MRRTVTAAVCAAIAFAAVAPPVGAGEPEAATAPAGTAVSKTDAAVAANRRADPEYGKHGGYLLDADYYTNFVRVPYRLAISPLKWKAEHYRTAALIAAGIGVLAFFDEPIRDFWQDDVRGDGSDGVADATREFGAIYPLLGASGAGFAVGAAIGDRDLQATSAETLQALLISAAFVEGLKNLTHRHRPNDSPDDAFDFDGPSLDGDHKSFVSGHATYPFAAASVIASAYPDNDFVAPVVYTIAGLTAWSRVNDDKHWASDVAVGALIGYSLGKLVHGMSPFRRNNKTVSLKGYSNGDATGLQLAVRF